jgi:hypothetical protein
MSKFSICLAAAATIALAALMPEPASAGSGDGYVEGGYGLGWYGGRPYYYTPFGVYGGNAYQYRSDTYRPSKKRLGYRYRSYGYR